MFPSFFFQCTGGEHILHSMLSLLAVVEDGTVTKNSQQTELLSSVGNYLGLCVSIFTQSLRFLLRFFRWTHVGQKVAIDDLAIITGFAIFLCFPLLLWGLYISWVDRCSSRISILVLWKLGKRCLGVLCDHTEREEERVIYAICKAGSLIPIVIRVILWEERWQSSALLMTATSGLISPLFIGTVSVAVLRAFV